MKYARLPIHFLFALLGFAGIGLLATDAKAEGDDEARWSITPYIWASDTSLDFSLNGSPVGGADLSFGDILDTLDAALQLHVERRKGSWSGFVDFSYLALSDSVERPIVRIDIDSKQFFVDAAVAYWPGGAGSALSVFGGARYTRFDDKFGMSVDGNPVGEARTKKDYVDALLGIRYRFDISERWGLLTHGDFSFGSSEGTWLVQGLFAYTVGKRRQNNLMFGYRYKQAEFKDAALGTDYEYSGPIAGFNFRF